MMMDRGNPGPLGSDELERDRAGQDEALGDSLARSENDQATTRDPGMRESGPDPIAGTMLPPD